MEGLGPCPRRQALSTAVATQEVTVGLRNTARGGGTGRNHGAGAEGQCKLLSRRRMQKGSASGVRHRERDKGCQPDG